VVGGVGLARVLRLVGRIAAEVGMTLVANNSMDRMIFSCGIWPRLVGAGDIAPKVNAIRLSLRVGANRLTPSGAGRG
jgi:hypothetical protein